MLFATKFDRALPVHLSWRDLFNWRSHKLYNLLQIFYVLPGGYGLFSFSDESAYHAAVVETNRPAFIET
jgi:hypothetical protein